MLILCFISLTLCMAGSYGDSVWMQSCKKATVFNEAFIVVRERKKKKSVE